MGKKQMLNTATGGDVDATAAELSPAMSGMRNDVEGAILGGQNPPVQSTPAGGPEGPLMDQIRRARSTPGAVAEGGGNMWAPTTVPMEGAELTAEQATDVAATGADQAAQPQVDPATGATVAPEQLQQPQEYIDPATGKKINLSLQAPNLGNQRYYKQDFYSPEPDISYTGLAGGKMHVPSYGEVPLTLLAGRLQAEQQEKARRQEKQDASMKALRDMKTAPQFQVEYAGFVDSQLQSSIAAKAELFGSEQAALDYFFNTPKGKMEWAKMSADLQAVGTEVLHVATQAAGFMDKVEKEQLMASAEDKEYARRVIAGTASLGTDGQTDLRQLIADSREFDRIMSRSAFVKDRIAPNAERFMQSLGTSSAYKAADDTWVLTESGEKNYNGMIETFADEMVSAGMFQKTGTSSAMAEARKYLKGLFPTSTSSQKRVSDGGGGGSGDGTAKPAAPTIRGAYGVQTSKRPTAAKGTETVSVTGLNKDGKTEYTQPFSVRDGKGFDSQVVVTDFEYDEKEKQWYVVGFEVEGTASKDVSASQERGAERGAAGSGDKDGISTSQNTTINTTISNQGGVSRSANLPFFLPLDDIRTTIKTQFGSDDPYEIGEVYQKVAAYNQANPMDAINTRAEFQALSKDDRQRVVSGLKPLGSAPPMIAAPTSSATRKRYNPATGKIE